MVSVPAVEVKNVTKAFGKKVIANKDVSMSLEKGEILALLGENGSGKTTLMNMLAGIYYPDEGEIRVDGKPADIRSPKDAYDLGIGMVHQHFKLVDVFTAAENVALGLSSEEKYDLKAVSDKVRDIASQYNFKIDPDKKVYDMSVSEKQTVEIVKLLYRGANILILDEPTAVLTPQETEQLFEVMRSMKKAGKSLIIITHKLNEVLAISDRVAVLRKGEYIGDMITAEADAQKLTDMMVGRKVTLNIERPEPLDPKPRLTVEGLTVYDEVGVKRLDNVSFTANSGEILGIAGVAGSGQRELLESIAGLHAVRSGSIIFDNPKTGEKVQLVGKSPTSIRNEGIGMAFVPEDRLGMGLVGSMGMSGNMILRLWRKNNGPFVNLAESDKMAENIKERLEVVTPSVTYPVRRLSGGNVQKVLVGREIAQEPAVLMTAYAVRGLDINTSYTIYNLLTEEKMKGIAVVYVGEDLDVLLELCDRLMVMCDGKIIGTVDARTATKEQIGRMMTGETEEGDVHE